jgi:hypothetical protein
MVDAEWFDSSSSYLERISQMIRIENWSLSMDNDNPYQAPEQRKKRLHGDVYNHPRLGDLKDVTTSSIVSVDGCMVETRSGTVYELGEPSADYVNWCREHGTRVPTKEEPIKMK